MWKRFLDGVTQSFRASESSKAPTPQQQPAPEPAREAAAEPPNALREASRAYNQQNPAVRGVEHVPDGTSVRPSSASAVAPETGAQRGRGRSLTPERTPAPSYPRSPPSLSRAPEATQAAPAQPIPGNDATDHTPNASSSPEKSAAKHPEMVDPKALLQAAEKIESRFDRSAEKAQSIEERYTQNQNKERQPNREQHRDKENDHDR